VGVVQNYEKWAKVRPDGTVGTTSISREDLGALGVAQDGTFWKPLPRGARSRKKWLWVASPRYTGWIQRYQGRLSVSHSVLTADGKDVVQVLVSLDRPGAALEDVEVAINQETVLVNSGEVLELGPTTAEGVYQITLVDARVWSSPSGLHREVVVLA
jgi:hypothetical protein